MSEIRTHKPSIRSTHIPLLSKKTSILQKGAGKSINEVLRMIGNVAFLAKEEQPANIVVFVEPDKQGEFIDLVRKQLSISEGAVITKNIEKINKGLSITTIICGLKEEINSAPGKNVLVTITGYENHVLDTLKLDLKLNFGEPHYFLQGAEDNMRSGLQSYGINKRIITLTILDATHNQSADFYIRFKDSRFQEWVGCVK